MVEGGVLLLAEVDEFDVEDEIATGFSTTGVFTVGEFGGDPEAAFFAFAHELKSFGPAGNDLIEGKLGGLAPRVGTVEDFSVEGHAGVVGGDGVEGVGSGAADTRAEDF